MKNGFLLYTKLTVTLAVVMAFMPSVLAKTTTGPRTSEAAAVFDNLRRLPDKGMFVYSWCHPWNENSPKAAELKGGFAEELGRHPVLYFTDFYFVTDATKSVEKRQSSRAILTAMVKKAWKDYRAVPVFSWHPENPYVLKLPEDEKVWERNAPYRYRYASKGYPQEHRYVVREILSGKGFAHDWYIERLKEIGDFLANLKDERGVAIPAVVRLFHECEDDWSWWGSGSVSAEDYKTLFRAMVARLRKRTDGNLLFAYSPDRYWNSAVCPTKPTDFLYRYPGDDVVDILGFDDYSIGNGKDDEEAKQIFDGVVRRMRMLADCARAKGKATGLFETGVLGATGKKTKCDDTYDLIFRAMTSSGARLGFVNTWGGGYTKPESAKGQVLWKRFAHRPEVLTYESGFNLVDGFRP